MAFLIENVRIPFTAYKTLSEYSNQYPIVEDIISALDEWYDTQVNFIKAKTSGSTGKPKVISHSKASVVQSCKKTESYFNLKKGQSSLICLPVNFIAGKIMLLRSLVSDLELRIVQPSSQPLKGIDASFDFVPMTPHQFASSLVNQKEQLSAIKHILLGGAPVSSDLMYEIQSMQNKIYLSYGMTETITHVAIQKLNGKTKDDGFYALDGVRFSTSPSSCLVIESDHLLGKIETHDVVELISENRFQWRGRIDNVINSGGVKLHPEILERKIESLLDSRFYFTGLPDPIFGEKLTLVVENQQIDFKVLISNLKKVLKEKEMPKEIRFVEHFIETPTGKIDRIKTNKLPLLDNKR